MSEANDEIQALKARVKELESLSEELVKIIHKILIENGATDCGPEKFKSWSERFILEIQKREQR